MFQCVSVLVLFLKELSHFRIACSLLSGCQSCNPYHFNLCVWIFSTLLKFLFNFRLSFRSVPLCCCRVLNSCLEVVWRLRQLTLGPHSCWEQALDFGTTGVLTHPKQHCLSRVVQLGLINLYSSTRFLCFAPLSFLGPGTTASDSLKRLECSY